MAEPEILLSRGRYRARLAACAADVAAAQALRSLCFAAAGGDGDRFDDACKHLLVEECAGGRLVCCLRMLQLESGKDLERSYSAQFYDLQPLQGFPGRLLEIGRFCIHPDWRDPDILRVAWGAVTGLVDRDGVQLLVGCSSFAGTCAEAHLDAFALLRNRHLAPGRWMPGVRAPEVCRFGSAAPQPPDLRRAMQSMPPLLRSYLLMGGWVSDHAVIDRRMNTLHVFTGLETGAIPESRKRLLRAVAGGN